MIMSKNCLLSSINEVYKVESRYFRNNIYLLYYYDDDNMKDNNGRNQHEKERNVNK